jgi:hypothetical protein
MTTGGRAVLSRIGWSVAFVLIILLAGIGYANRQFIMDRVSATGFDASPAVAELIERLHLTDQGDVVIRATQPTLESSQYFNLQCSRVDHVEGGHVLGCFSDGNIHLFEVTDERLGGIIEVTAAHELLHATHARMGVDERRVFDNRIADLYEELILTDSELEGRMAVYEGLSRSAFANELHSVLGTEVAVLPEWLEQHYAVWFTDRAAIIQWFDGYHGLFVALQQEGDMLNAELEQIRSDVEVRSAAYSTSVETFNEDVRVFKQRNNNYEFSSNGAEFDRIVAELENRRVALDTELAAIQAAVVGFDEKRARLEEIGTISLDLDNQIDSGLAPPADRVDE